MNPVSIILNCQYEKSCKKNQIRRNIIINRLERNCRHKYSSITSRKNFDIDELDTKLIIENAKEGGEFCMEMLEQARKHLG